MNYTEDQMFEISNNMIRHGGSFVAALGWAFVHADRTNTIKLVTAFPEYCEEYLNWKK